jgi:ureidoacrylate peracid hydrolase
MNNSKQNPLNEIENTILKMESPIQVNPKEAALLVIDLQVDYCSPEGRFATRNSADVSSNAKVIPDISEFISKSRSVGVTVIFTRMIEVPELMPKNLAKKINSFQNPVVLCDPSTNGFDYYKITPKTEDFQVIKNTYNSFLSDESSEILKKAGFDTPRLEDLLKERGVKTIILTGVLTSRCVQATLLGAIDRGYDCIVPHDLVSMPEGPWRIKHLVSLSEISIMFAEVTHSSKITFNN